MKSTKAHPSLKIPLGVLLVGDADHRDLRDAGSLLSATSCLTVVDRVEHAAEAIARLAQPPELIVVAQSRPGTVRQHEFRQLQRLVPLAGVVALLGSWCEGSALSGRPWAGVERLYWYEFRRWWVRELARRGAGRCPAWARMEGMRSEERGARKAGLIALSTPDYESYAALSDLLTRGGYATAWQRPASGRLALGGVTAGVWVGGQLDDRDADDLAAFCGQLAGDGTPVVALLDFPRRDRCRRALELGAAAVFSKPWLGVDLIDAIAEVTAPQGVETRAATPAQAA